MGNKKDDRLTVRLRPGEMLSLKELASKMKVSNSLLVRTIICDFLTRNEDTLERIMADGLEIDVEETDNAYN